MDIDEIGKMKITNLKNVIWLGVVMASTFWVFESLLHVYIFHEGTLIDQLFSATSHEIWMRSLVIGSYIIFTIFVYFVLWKQRKGINAIKQAYTDIDQIFQAAGDGMCVIDTDYNIVRINDRFFHLFGISKEKAEGKKCYDIYPNELCNTPNCTLKKILEGKERFECELEKESNNGEKNTFYLSVAPLRGYDGKLIGVIENFKNITEIKNTQKALRNTHDKVKIQLEQLQLENEERKKAEMEIKNLEQQIEFILGVTKTGLHIIDPNLNIQYIDPAWEKAHGDPSDKKCYEYFMGQNTACPDCVVQKSIETEKIMITEKTLEDDNNRTIQVSTIPFKDNNRGWLVAQIKVDISELKKAELEKNAIEAQLLQAQKMEAIGRLAGGIAHDFNNLLTTIMGYTELLLIDYKNPDQVNKYAEIIMKASKLASTLTHRLLAFSRRQVLKPKPLNLSSVLKDMEMMLNRIISEDIELKIVTDDNLEQVQADPGQIEQVILNLVVNGCDAMPEGGKLIIKTKNITLDKKCCEGITNARPGKFVCILIEDNGTGMDKKTINQIFEPFFTTKEERRGTGLGLSTAYGIINQHEGWINVYSELGQGSTFKIYLPAVSVEEKEKPEIKILLEELKGNGERILLVEDDQRVREFSTNVLQEKGYVIFSAPNADAAHKIFNKEKGDFQLIFSDVVLPRKNGVELVQELQQQKPELLVLLTSGYIDQKSQWHIIQKKGYPFLEKPYDVVALLTAIKKALKAQIQDT